MEESVQVISSEYCYSDSLKLKIDVKKGVTYIDDDKVVFRVKDSFFTLNNHPVLYDVSGNPIATFYRKNLSAHDRYQVFKGKSKDPKELMFQVKRSSVRHTGVIDLDVFMANNRNQTRVSDFKVNLSINKNSCEIYAAQSSRIIAKTKKMNNEMLEVLIQPNIDHAFIVALLMMVDRLKYFDGNNDFVLSAVDVGFESVLATLSTIST